MSFAELVRRFKEGFAPRTEQRPIAHQPLQLATAAVLLEIAYADGEFQPAEDGDVVGYLCRKFSLDELAARDLLRAADEIRTRTIDHYSLTSYIRKNMTLDDRLEIVRTMWRIVFADGRLTDYEGYLVRKLSDLLGIEHHIMIDAKVAVLAERGEKR